MTDPVHIAAERLLAYFDGDGDSGGETLLTHRPYLTILVDELRKTLDQPFKSSRRHPAPSR